MHKKGWQTVVRVFGAWKKCVRVLRKQRAWASGMKVKRRLVLLRRWFYVWSLHSVVAAERARHDASTVLFASQRKQVRAVVYCVLRAVNALWSPI
jgi:hypothetical protein